MIDGIEMDYGYCKDGGNILICGTESVQTLTNFSAGSMPENQAFIEVSSTDVDTILLLGDGHFHKALAYESGMVKFSGGLSFNQVLSSGKIVTRDDATVGDVGAPSLSRQFGTGRATLADDTVITITPPHTQGKISVSTNSSGYNGDFWFRITGSPNIEKMSAGGANIATGTTAMTNGPSDGTDAKINVAALNDGTLQIKNRSGFTLQLSWTVSM